MQTATYTFWNLSEQWLPNFKVPKCRSHFAALKEFFCFFWQWVYIFGVLNEDCFANLFGHMLFQWLSYWWRLEHKPKKKQVIHSCTGFCRDELQVFSKDVVTCYLPPLLIASSSAHLDVFCVPFEPYDISWSSLFNFYFWPSILHPLRFLFEKVIWNAPSVSPSHDICKNKNAGNMYLLITAQTKTPGWTWASPKPQFFQRLSQRWNNVTRNLTKRKRNKDCHSELYMIPFPSHNVEIPAWKGKARSF